VKHPPHPPKLLLMEKMKNRAMKRKMSTASSAAQKKRKKRKKIQKTVRMRAPTKIARKRKMMTPPSIHVRDAVTMIIAACLRNNLANA
jgi:hypothetical protein